MGDSPKKNSRSKKAGHASKPDGKNGNVTKRLNAVSRQDAAGYINDMAFEMKSLAEKAKLSFLSYLLDLVIEESGTQKRGTVFQRIMENDRHH